ncbi:hypothetical protein [Glutamicibacter protophormiae]|uniref:hypothetical protein n=1 Tax=Glutamicibacter protophormiae TaxID=37930 RepID=UPI00195A8310|nr:hypothetical protein [Glutamicibacter protophormiae]QRQ77233.1 hypothetical protein JQN66_09695 [Glutamicibacter protophormiae]
MTFETTTIDQEPEGSGPSQESSGPSRRAVLALIPIGMLGLAMTGIGVGKLMSAPKLTATPLGAMGAVSGVLPASRDSFP